jgi:ectoine hydroxylase-related dioxygenase (phytanoyl-CoA dioxygenase family)
VSPALVTTEQVDAFRRDGFVVVAGLLNDDELDHFGPLVIDAVAHRSGADTRTLDERSPYEQSFQQCINLWEDHPAIRPLTFHQAVGQAAAELIGADAIRLWHDQALFKRAGGRQTDAHQDQPYWPIKETDTITAWIPFDGSTFASGAMGYLPGSHLVGLRRFQNIFQGEDPEATLKSPEIAGIEPVYVEVPRGGIAFHSGLTVHMAMPNTTDTDRAVHTVIMFADGCTRGSERFHFSVDRDGTKVGERIGGPCTPIIWPRADDELPPPPPPMAAELVKMLAAGLLPTPQE